MDSVFTISEHFVNCLQAITRFDFCTYDIKIFFLFQMEELCKSRKFHFPGYDGALPKAMRTSRGRSAYQRKVNQDPTDLNCIELLATVAGQVLQAKSLREENVDTQRDYTIEPMNSGGVSSCQMNLPSMVEDVCNLENRQDLYIAQMMNGKDVDKAAASNVFKESGLPTFIVCPHNARNVLSVNPSEGNVGLCNMGEVTTSEVNIVLKEEGSMPTSTPEVPEPGHLDNHMQSESFKESNAGCGSLKDANMNEGGSCMTLPDDSPQSLSSSSSEETPTHVYKHTHSPCSEQPLETHLDFSQELARLNAKDDDDNFSDLVVPATTPPVRHLVPFIEKTQQLMQAQQENNFYQVEESATVVARTTDGNNDVEGHLHCLRKFPSQQPRGRKMRRSSKSCKVSIDSYKSRSFNPLDSDAKDTSVGSSPTTIKGSRRSVKRKSNEIHDCSPVKVNITSFRVPELSINLPETATVANLKRAVMEAAVNLLGGGLHVRVLHHGKKVHDENSTLIQMGIACKDRLDSLAFMLEPSGVSNTSMSIEESVFGYPKGKSLHAACYPVFGDDLDADRQKAVNGTNSGDAETDASNNTEGEEKKDLMSNVGECVKLQKGGVPCRPPTPATAALVVHPHAEGDLPAELVMAGQQNFVSFSGKRRTRRPFTVLEVEALVQAVELLGTGRWREVKQQVFSHARHRTYVDLKDKWKTLVHTARIAPHQRRGEPVPQELLDRVLQAHTYWAVQLAKQQEDMGI